MGFCGDDIAFAPHIVHLGKWKYDAVSVSDGSRTWYLLPQVVNTEDGPVTFGYYAFNSAQQLEDHLADVEILLIGRGVIYGAAAMAEARLSARSMCQPPGYQRGFPRIKAPATAPKSGLAGQIAGPSQRLAGQINTIANMRPFAERVADISANSSRWQVVRSASEVSSNIRNRGGSSLQEILRNTETGETLVRHTIFKANGSIFEAPHFRPFWK